MNSKGSSGEGAGAAPPGPWKRLLRESPGSRQSAVRASPGGGGVGLLRPLVGVAETGFRSRAADGADVHAVLEVVGRVAPVGAGELQHVVDVVLHRVGPGVVRDLDVDPHIVDPGDERLAAV